MDIDAALADEVKNIDNLSARLIGEVDIIKKIKLMRVLKLMIESYLSRRQVN